MYSRSIGCPSTRSASCRDTSAGFTDVLFEPLLLERDRVALARIRIPARVVDDAKLAAAFGQAADPRCPRGAAAGTPRAK